LKSSLAEINQLSRIPLSSNDAEAIENEILQPIKQRLESQKSYRDAFRGHLEKQDLEQHSVGLQRWAKDTLKLTDADIAEIEQAEQQRLTAKKAREASVVVPLPITPTPPPPSTPAAPLPLPTETFEFEVATIIKGGLFKKPEINRTRKRAKCYTQDLGNNIFLDMVAIPGGSFRMGSTENSDEQPVHQVTIAPFFLGRYPITQSQWRVVAGFPKVKIDLEPDPANFKGGDRPVEKVSWWEAVEFCQRLSHKTNRTYRLPSEAEWEYACRAGTTTPFHFGEIITTDLANYNGTATYNSSPKGQYRQETTAVGSFGVANAFGLYDMHGNVYEWCADHWHGNYAGAPIDGSAWLTEEKDAALLMRGGSWNYAPVYCQSAFRLYYNPDDCGSNLGFRVVCGLA